MASRIILTEEEQNNRNILLEEYTHYKMNLAHGLDDHLEHMSMMIWKLESTHLFLSEREMVSYLQQSLPEGWAKEIQEYWQSAPNNKKYYNDVVTHLLTKWAQRAIRRSNVLSICSNQVVIDRVVEEVIPYYP